MGARYILGSWLWSRGYDLSAMPPYYNWGKSRTQNFEEGRMPTQELLLDARAPFVAFGAATVAVIYAIGRAIDGRLAGLVAAAATLASPLTRAVVPLVWPESPMMFFILLALLGVQRGRRGG